MRQRIKLCKIRKANGGEYVKNVTPLIISVTLAKGAALIFERNKQRKALWFLPHIEIHFTPNYRPTNIFFELR